MLDHAFLIKYYYKCDSNERRALQRYRSVREICRGPIAEFEVDDGKVWSHGYFISYIWEGRKPTSVVIVESVAFSVKEAIIESTHSMYRVHAVNWTYHGVQCTKLSVKLPYKIQNVQEFQCNKLAERESFALKCLAQMEVDKHWPWNILWTDEAHFLLKRSCHP